ncbi:MAG: response regulator [Proteobacteria bacterium]|nr:response regulator [Pseudomonadota bacterium]
MSEPQYRVLYVDDDEGLRQLVRRSLQRRGYDVILAESGEAGLLRLEEGEVDVVALDHFMPGLGGFATLERICALRDPPPVIYVTGSDESRVAVSALKAGAADYVVKTVGEEFFDLLDTAIVQALEKTELHRRHAQSQAELHATNLRLEALLHEVNHRVANSLQLVSSLVRMQASAVEGEARAALKDTQRRIEAIIQVHRRLYASEDVQVVEMRDYLAPLVRELEDTLSSSESPRRIVLDADDVKLPTDQAISVGVVVNELVTNACKYAYKRGQDGEVRVRLTPDGDGFVRLSVEDDGPGLSDGGAKGTGLGARLIKAMAHSLKSEVAYDSSPSGVKVGLRIPVR